MTDKNNDERERKTETVRSTGGWRRGIRSPAGRWRTEKKGREQHKGSERVRDEQEGWGQ